MSENPSWTKWMLQAAASTARARDLTLRSSPSGLARSSRIPLTVQREGGSMPISITRVYTRTGDKGETSLVGGKRIPKDSPRIVAYGTVDEVLRKIQNQLFDLGSELATPPDAEYEGMFKVGEGEVKELEELMDRCQKDLPPLKSFVLPGGGRINGFLHQARTVCRRAERELLALSRQEPIGEWPLRFLNRLSDVFFVLGRWVGKHLGEQEYLWERGLSSHARPRKARS